MSEYNIITVGENSNDLKEKLKINRILLLELMNQWEVLENETKPTANSRYNLIFHVVLEKIRITTLDYEKLERFLDLLAVKITRGEDINQNLIEKVDKIVEAEFIKKVKVDSEKKNISESTKDVEITIRKNMANSSEIQVMYRKIIKSLHPDINEESSDFRKYWNKAVDAYKSKDYTLLNLLYKTICLEDKLTTDLQINSEKNLRIELRDLEFKISAESRKLSRELNKFPVCFNKNFTDNEWIENHKNQLTKDLKYLEIRIIELKKLKDDIILSNGNTATEFDSNFFETTYGRR